MKKETYNKGQVIFREGDYGACMYDILWGTVGIYTGYDTPRQKMLVELLPEECFGEMGLIEAYPRSATAVAMCDGVQVQVVETSDFETYFKEKPAKIFKIMQQQSHRLRELTKDYLEACRTVSEAVAAEERGQKKTGWLARQMQRLSKTYRAAEPAAGARTEPVSVRSDGFGVEEALASVDAFLEAQGITGKSALHIRLLSEETLGMVRSITGDLLADFWAEKQGNTVELHLKGDTIMDADKRAQLLDVTFSGKNEAAVGVMGKLREMFAVSLLESAAVGEMTSQAGGMALNYGAMGMMNPESFALARASYDWSLKRYQESLEKTRGDSAAAEDAWDELERSVVANLASDVKISIRGNDVEMVVYKTI